MEAPKIPSLFGFKSKKPDQFYFEPRYYDVRKEKMNKRYDSMRRQLEENPSFKKSNTQDFKTTMRESWNDSSRRNSFGNKMNTRVIIYALALGAIAYYILF
jgi:hypothetical protein